MVDLQDKEAFADKLRKLAMDGSKRFDGFQYDVEADIEKFVDISQKVGLTGLVCTGQEDVGRSASQGRCSSKRWYIAYAALAKFVCCSCVYAQVWHCHVW